MKTDINDKSLMSTIREKFDDFWETDRWFPEDLLTRRLRANPAVNIVNLTDEYCIEMAVPGLTKEDIKIEIKHGLLTISAEKTDKEVFKDENFTRREFNFSAFTRSFMLPDNVNPDVVDAKYRNGVLTLHLKKFAPEKMETKRINIK